TPIKVNDNVIDVLITPGEAGQPATVTWRPMTSAVQVDAHVETASAGGETRVDIRGAGDRRVVVRGQIAAGRAPLVMFREVDVPASFARSLLIEALRAAGVTIDASPLAVNQPALLPSAGSYAKLKRVALIKSPPFAESARLILKVSHNLQAGTLPLLI